MLVRTRLGSLCFGLCLAALSFAPRAWAQDGMAPEAAAPVDSISDAPAGPGMPQYGGAFRLRFVSVPTWFLNAFTKENTSLASYHTGFEFQRRKGDMDIVLGLSFQDMSPPDGNWLGKNKDPAKDVDYLQFKGLSMWTLDVAFIWNTWINDYVTFRYGAGLGLGVIAGKILRTSAGPCTFENASNEATCKPVLNPPCPAEGPCPDDRLLQTEGVQDRGPSAPHRFKEKDVPGAIPVLNVVLGPSFTMPDLPGFEARLEAGWFNAFFAGFSLSYMH